MTKKAVPEPPISSFLEKLPRRIFIISVVVAVLVCGFLYGVFAYKHSLPPVPLLKVAKKTLFGDLAQDPVLFHLQPTRGQGNGVMVNQGPDDGALIFMVGFFEEENQARLIRRDGTLVRKWSLDYLKHFPDLNARPCDIVSPLRVDAHGALVTPLGELVFNYDFCGTVKLDQCGRLIWTIAQKTHHSLIRAEEGGYLLLRRKEWRASENTDRFPPFSTPPTDETILEDTIIKISEDGEVLEEFSIPELMRENGLEALLTANGTDFNRYVISRRELVHANKVAQLPVAMAESYPLFSAGDLLISMRNLNLVMVIDPVTKAVKWHQTGPWLRQHDTEFRPDGRISIFNNNVYKTAYNAQEHTDLSTPHTTNIIVVDPVTRATEVVFGEKPGQEMLSVIRGQHELLENDRMLITEFDAGRVLEVDQDGHILWEYVNQYNDEYVGEITNSSLYPNDYFQIDWQTCSQ